MSYVSDRWCPGSQPPDDERWCLIVLYDRHDARASWTPVKAWFSREHGRWWLSGGGFKLSDQVVWWHPIPYTPEQVVSGKGGG